MSDSLRPYGLYSPWNSPGQNTGVGSLSLLQGTFPTQGSNPALPHCRRILHQLSHKGSPRILKWVVYPFSSASFLTQEFNQGLLHCRWILYQLSYQVIILSYNDLLEKALAPHSSTLAWKIPWAEEPGRLQSMGSQRVRHD